MMDYFCLTHSNNVLNVVIQCLLNKCLQKYKLRLEIVLCWVRAELHRQVFVIQYSWPRIKTILPPMDALVSLLLPMALTGAVKV